MKKGIYRAVDLKQIDIEKVNTVLAGCVAEVAVDAAKETQYAAIRPEGQEVIRIVKWEQPSEMGEFLEFLGSLDAKAVEVIVESTGTYADPLRYQVRKAGYAVFRASTKRVSDAAEVYDGVPSCHDAKAAWVIGRLHQQGHLLLNQTVWVTPPWLLCMHLATSTVMETCRLFRVLFGWWITMLKSVRSNRPIR